MERSFQERYHHGKGDLAAPGNFRVNNRFNRLEYSDHAYRVYHGGEIGDSVYEGYFKTKLVHAQKYSIFVPDLIYIKTTKQKFKWFQFYSFIPGLIDTNDLRTSICIDISGGHTIEVSFKPEDHIKNLADNSNLFKCKIKGPTDIMEFATGVGAIIEEEPFIKLYHHTKPETEKKIFDSGALKGSAWNIQGNKELLNISYAYFTSLDQIKKPIDLKAIAMSSNAKIKLIVDRTMETFYLDDVYRESTFNRTASIPFWVNSSLISSNHVNQRKYDEPENPEFFYEITNSFIYRVGIKPGSMMVFQESIIRKSEVNIFPNYIILGNSYTKQGVIAPFDEENTEMIGKIQPFEKNDENLIEFLLNNKNKDFYNSLEASLVEFKQGTLP